MDSEQQTEWVIPDSTTVTLETLNDLLVTAVEGGTGYWSQIDNYEWDTDVAYARFVYDDPNDPDEKAYRTVFATDLVTILDRLVSESGQAKHNGWNLAATLDNMDADIADIAVQLYLFGEVTYG